MLYPHLGGEGCRAVLLTQQSLDKNYLQIDFISSHTGSDVPLDSFHYSSVSLTDIIIKLDTILHRLDMRHLLILPSC